jgi:predicted nuclease with TOPRIM domain
MNLNRLKYPGGDIMPIIDDPDFLTNRTKQLSAVHELSHLRSRLVDLQSELLNRMQERRQIIQRVAEQDLARQKEAGRASRSAALQRARASEEVRTFDQNVASLRERIRRLEIDIERDRLSIEVAIAGAADRSIGLMAQRGAA